MRTLIASLLRISLILFILIGVFPGSVSAQETTANPQIVAPLPSATVTQEDKVVGPVYTATMANGLIYAGVGGRLAIISGPANHLAQLWQSDSLTSGNIKGIETSGSTLIMVTDYALFIFDISEPLSPKLKGKLVLEISINKLVIFDHYALIGSSPVDVVDWGDAANPKVVASIDAAVINIVVDGKKGYFQSSTGLLIYDLKNPVVPILKGTFSYTWNTDVGIDVKNGLAVVTTDSHFWTIDVSNPLAVKILNEISDGNYSGQGVSLSGSRAYILEFGGNILVYDLAVPSDPKFLESFGLGPNEYYWSPLTFKVNGDWIIAANGKLSVLKIPGQSTDYETGSFGINQIADFITDGNLLYTVGNGEVHVLSGSTTSPGSTFHEVGKYVADDSNSYLAKIWKQGNYIYLGGQDDYNAKYIWILDASDVSNIKLVNLIKVPFVETIGTDVSSITVTGSTLYLTTRSFTTGEPSGALILFDISNPVAPTQIYAADIGQGIYGLALKGNDALLATENGLNVYDVSNLHLPLKIGSYHTPNAATGISIASNVAYIVASGVLYDLDISIPSAPALLGSIPQVAGYGISPIFIQSGLVFTNYFVLAIGDPRNPLVVSTLSSYHTGYAVFGNDILANDGAAIERFHAFPALEKHVSSSDNQFISSSDKVSYSIPTTCFYGEGNLKHTILDPVVAPPLGLLRSLRHFSLQNLDAPIWSNCAVQLQIQFTKKELARYDEGSLKLYDWDGKDWQPDDSSKMDLATHMITATFTGIPYQNNEWAIFGRMGPSFTSNSYLPILSNFPGIVPDPGMPDLSFSGMEVTQGTQTLAQTVPLVAGRKTILRIYPLSGNSQPVVNGNFLVEAWRNNVMLAGSPLKIGPWAIFPSSSRASNTSDSEIILPAEWTTSGSTRLRITIDPDNQVIETNEANNIREITVTFNTMPALGITIVPVNYHIPDGTVVPPQVLSADEVAREVMPLYPLSAINVTFHPVVDWTGDLSKDADWPRFLNFITGLKSSEHAPAKQVYYGLVPNNYPHPYWGGLGWIGERSAIGDLGSLAHEVGHNFGLPHAPCGTAGDPNYPYANGSIGQPAIDVYTFDIKGISTYKDLMSYCWPKWISDYNYIKLYNNQRQVGAVQQEAQNGAGLMIRITMNSHESLQWQPIYRMDGPVLAPVPTSSPYRLDLVDSSGNVVQSQSVDLLEAAEGASSPSISAMVPLNNLAFTGVRLYNGNQLLGETKASLIPFNGKVAQNATIENGLIHIKVVESAFPVLIQVRPSGGDDWETLGMDLNQGDFSFNANDLPAGRLEFRVISSGIGGSSPMDQFEMFNP